MLSVVSVSAGPVYQPPGANLTYGDVTHGQRVQSASSNPAAAAADLVRGEGRGTRGTVISGAAGLEYGNVQDLFDFYDAVTRAYEPSDPGEGGGPGQNPDDKPDGGIDLGDVLDMLDPEYREALDAIAREVVVQTALLALIAVEGYGKAWLSADAPFVIGSEHLGGTWTFGVGWYGSAKAFGLTEAIDFDRDAALEAIDDWVNTLPINRPVELPISDDIILRPRPGQNALFLAIDNDSSLITKSTQTTELNVGYSRQAWAHGTGKLFFGAEARLYLKQLSRLSVRFGDITDSEELFDAIRDADFTTDEGLGIDLGVLWVADNYQLGAQVTNVNEPEFLFPDVNLAPYRSPGAVRILERDKKYRMDRQLKLEASMFTQDRRWSAHVGYDADPATDPMGDRFQWLTMSMGFVTDSWWIPGGRIGYRKNLAGTELGYLGIGVTAFKIVNFDIASALDTVKIDGEKLPQGLMASIGFQIVW
ncbi:MAG: conjugal transfer protein TraF [Woeseiaceae bacterium]